MINEVTKWIKTYFPGILFVFLIALLANYAGSLFPVIGGAVFSLLIGFLIRQFFSVPDIAGPGVSYTLKKLLKLAIILLGFGFSFTQIFQVGLDALIIVTIAVITGVFLTFFISRLAGLHGNIPLLIGLGTGICGATAIVTSGSIIKAKEEETLYAVNTIFAFNVLAVVIYPLIGNMLALSDHDFGVWAGAAIHDTSSVVAAGYSFSNEAGDTSVVVKLIRTLLLVPVAVALSFLFSMKSKGSNGTETKWSAVKKSFPVFILFFAGAAALNTFVSLPESWTEQTSSLAKFIITMVMASVGLGTDFKKIKAAGLRPLLVGLVSSAIMGGISLLLVLYMS
ncbi:YeiH family protein [Cytobacillus gottheilii]|uniref:YeiH family protein n=1 Tax=Cytobacillus gottheilii TaxID=859144 RepID=UPI0009BB022D|nr:putative sulfate exporter family transporter [Cytobacillus gottheilii]